MISKARAMGVVTQEQLILGGPDDNASVASFGFFNGCDDAEGLRWLPTFFFLVSPGTSPNQFRSLTTSRAGSPRPRPLLLPAPAESSIGLSALEVETGIEVSLALLGNNGLGNLTLLLG